MNFISTRGQTEPTTLSQAIQQGLAPDGGLYVPEAFLHYDLEDFSNKLSLPDFAKKFLSPFFDGDLLADHLTGICHDTFNFAIPIIQLTEEQHLLELFHGPTGAFKDIGAQFIAQCLSSFKQQFTILVATSGDTGSAVAAAFHNMTNINVIILYPKDKISSFQENQLIYWNNNIYPLRVNGDFDNCQNLVKECFSDEKLKNEFQLTSANSINLGRLLPQCVYYAYSSLKLYRRLNKKINFIIPSGNMGNALAAIWVKQMGFPIDKITLSSNANKTIPDYFSNGKFIPKASVKTIANAMDVGNPSNMERYLDLVQRFSFDEGSIDSYSVDDYEIEELVRNVYKTYHIVVCPHTATSFANKISRTPTVYVATAHPFKFESVIRPLISENIPIPNNLRHFVSVEKDVLEIPASLNAIRGVLRNIV